MRERGGEPGIPAESARGVEGNKFSFEPALRASSQGSRPSSATQTNGDVVERKGEHSEHRYTCRDRHAMHAQHARYLRYKEYLPPPELLTYRYVLPVAIRVALKNVILRPIFGSYNTFERIIRWHSCDGSAGQSLP